MIRQLLYGLWYDGNTIFNWFNLQWFNSVTKNWLHHGVDDLLFLWIVIWNTLYTLQYCIVYVYRIYLYRHEKTERGVNFPVYIIYMHSHTCIIIKPFQNLYWAHRSHDSTALLLLRIITIIHIFSGWKHVEKFLARGSLKYEWFWDEIDTHKRCFIYMYNSQFISILYVQKLLLSEIYITIIIFELNRLIVNCELWVTITNNYCWNKKYNVNSSDKVIILMLKLTVNRNYYMYYYGIEKILNSYNIYI